MDQSLSSYGSDETKVKKLEKMRKKYAESQLLRTKKIQKASENRDKRKIASQNDEQIDDSGSNQSQKNTSLNDASMEKKLKAMKDKYAYSQSFRMQKIHEASRNRDKRKKISLNDNGRSKKRQCIDWLLRAQSQAYQTESDETVYEPSCSELHVLKPMHICFHCGAMKFEFETPTFCCDNGKIKLAETHVPSDLEDLFISQSDEAKEFRKNVRVYNSLFSFTCFVVNLNKDLASSRKEIYTFRVQGQVYHHLPGLTPSDSGPCFFQLYFHDTNNEIKNRMKIMKDGTTTEPLTRRIMKLLEFNNPYVKVFRKLQDLPSINDVHLHISRDINIDQRVYNSPTADQVAAIWIEGNESHIPTKRNIVVHSHSGNIHRVQHYDACYDPLQYPLLYPSGEIGWHQNVRKVCSGSNSSHLETVVDSSALPVFPMETESTLNVGMTSISSSSNSGNNESHRISSIPTVRQILEEHEEGVPKISPKNVSPREYYCYKFQIRYARQSMLHCAGRLFQQYVMDQYIKIETTRVDFLRYRQNDMRTELYQGIVDSVVNGEARACEIGQRIVLPSSFIGGGRDMRRRYLDAICLVQRFGKSDLFITMTCNPDWLEIQEQLLPSQTPQDRPDLTSRVFRAKFQDLKDQLFKKAIFGEVIAHVHVIEFQKRGLPHAHILMILKSEFKIKTPDQFDKFVCSKIPDETKYPELYKLVVKHVMHGPCGDKNKGNSCMVNGNCKYHYPREFCERTTQGKEGYPTYRRRRDNKTAQVRNAHLDNRWTIYNSLQSL